MNKPAILLSLLICFSLNACTTILDYVPWLYKIDIEQGNIVDQSMVDQLRPNMTKRQVLFIMGTPMVSDMFHEKRWDYIYSKAPSGEDRVQKRISLFFNGENLIGIQGDFHPSSNPLPVTKASAENNIELPKRDLEKSMWEKIAGLFGISVAPDADSETQPFKAPSKK